MNENESKFERVNNYANRPVHDEIYLKFDFTDRNSAAQQIFASKETKGRD